MFAKKTKLAGKASKRVYKQQSVEKQLKHWTCYFYIWGKACKQVNNKQAKKNIIGNYNINIYLYGT